MNWTPGELFFDGRTYDPAQDRDRLSKLLGRVYAFLSDHEWHTLSEIHEACGGSETGCSAKLRDLRKDRFGGYRIESERAEGGLWRYRMVKHD